MSDCKTTEKVVYTLAFIYQYYVQSINQTAVPDHVQNQWSRYSTPRQHHSPAATERTASLRTVLTVVEVAMGLSVHSEHCSPPLITSPKHISQQQQQQQSLDFISIQTSISLSSSSTSTLLKDTSATNTCQILKICWAEHTICCQSNETERQDKYIQESCTQNKSI